MLAAVWPVSRPAQACEDGAALQVSDQPCQLVLYWSEYGLERAVPSSSIGLGKQVCSGTLQVPISL